MVDTIAALRTTVARIEGHIPSSTHVSIPLCPEIDALLPGRGLARGAFHEVLVADPGAAVGWAALVLARAAGTVLWIGKEPDIWPYGHMALGLKVANLVVVSARSAQDGLWAFEEALRSPGVAGTALMLDGPAPDLIAARRLQLAAEAGGGIGLLILPDTDRMPPSAARSRWRIGTAPSFAFDRPSWDVTLLRAAGGRSGRWTVTWDPDMSELRTHTDRIRQQPIAAAAS